MGRDGAGQNGTGWDGTGRSGTERNGMGWDGTERDGAGRDKGYGRDGDEDRVAASGVVCGARSDGIR